MAQTPLFLDGTAFGGSKVFSEGVNPLGNSARFDQPQPQPALYATYIDGDQRSKDNKSVLDDISGSTGPTLSPTLLDRLSNSPWALRTRGYGITYIDKSGNASFTHEDFHSFLAVTDQGYADVRKSAVDRTGVGVGKMEQGMAFGVSLRIEQWKMGTETRFVNPTGTQLALSGGSDPFTFGSMPNKTITEAIDFGFIYELMPGVLLGGTLDRLNQKHMWDVYEKPQARVGLQVDIGSIAKLSAEMDLNAAQRMPFPVNQRTTSASLKIVASQSITFLVGAELKKIGDASVARGGVAVQIRAKSFVMGLGFQIGQDKPLRGVVMVVD